MTTHELIVKASKVQSEAKRLIHEVEQLEAKSKQLRGRIRGAKIWTLFWCAIAIFQIVRLLA